MQPRLPLLPRPPQFSTRNGPRHSTRVTTAPSPALPCLIAFVSIPLQTCSQHGDHRARPACAVHHCAQHESTPYKDVHCWDPGCSRRSSRWEICRCSTGDKEAWSCLGKEGSSTAAVALCAWSYPVVGHQQKGPHDVHLRIRYQRSFGPCHDWWVSRTFLSQRAIIH